jgi:nucleoside-triphosphatase THEP1
MRVIILTGPKFSGKTTRLLSWCTEKKVSVCGFVTATHLRGKAGLKELLDLDTKEIYPFETSGPSDEATIQVGTKPFFLLKSGFDQADCIISRELNCPISNSPTKCIVVDEIGTLEVSNSSGHHNALLDLLSQDGGEFRWRGGVLLVVREGLVEAVLSKYLTGGLSRSVQIITIDELQTIENLRLL